jgi:Zn-dependent peptidase ImmA (M78 family)
LPVDVYALADDLGLKIFFENLSASKVSGKLVRDNDNFHIVVNNADPVSRQRFTIAHEIAHFVLHRDLIDRELKDDVMYRSGLSDTYEIEANRLAADILLPSDRVKVEYRKKPALVPLADKFQVSVEALRVRLKQLGYAP